MTAKPKRRWYQFNIRTLLVVTALVTIPLARIGYMGQRAAFHHREAIRFASCLKLEYEREHIWTWRKHTYTSLVTNHTVLRDRYYAAMYRPWTIVDDSPLIELHQSP